MNDCLFCKIISGDVQSKTVYENDFVKVFMDINPDSNGHMLIVPKKHFTDFNEITDEYLSEVNKAAKLMSKLVMDRLFVKGLSLVVNYGDRQVIKHYHLHIIPNDTSSLKDVGEVYEALKNKN